MADQNPEKKRRWLDFLRRQQQPPPKPEPSYFDPPKPDREKERQEQKPRPSALPHVAPLKVAKPASPDRHDPRNTFNRRSKVEESRQESILNRFETDRQRATALAHLDDAAALRKATLERFEANMAPIHAKWDRVDTSKPVPGEMVIDLKAREDTAVKARDKDLAEIESDLDLALKATQTAEVKVKFQTKILSLGFTPDATERFNDATQNWPQRFNRAADTDRDDARRALSAKVATTPENDEISRSPEPDETTGFDQGAPEPEEQLLYEQYEMDWLSKFEEIERDKPAPIHPEVSPDIRGPKLF